MIKNAFQLNAPDKAHLMQQHRLNDTIPEMVEHREDSPEYEIGELIAHSDAIRTLAK